MPVRFASAATATASPAVDAPTWSCETCAHVDERAEAWCSMCECSRVAGDPRRTPRDDARREREETDASETQIERHPSAESDAAIHRSEARTTHRTMHDKVSKIVNRLAAPATTVFNGALVGAFAVAGASLGALAGAVAARAASRGVSVLRVRGLVVGRQDTPLVSAGRFFAKRIGADEDPRRSGRVLDAPCRPRR